jgi:hypothetical protein
MSAIIVLGYVVLAASLVVAIVASQRGLEELSKLQSEPAHETYPIGSQRASESDVVRAVFESLTRVGAVEPASLSVKLMDIAEADAKWWRGGIGDYSVIRSSPEDFWLSFMGDWDLHESQELLYAHRHGAPLFGPHLFPRPQAIGIGTQDYIISAESALAAREDRLSKRADTIAPGLIELWSSFKAGGPDTGVMGASTAPLGA